MKIIDLSELEKTIKNLFRANGFKPEVERDSEENSFAIYNNNRRICYVFRIKEVEIDADSLLDKDNKLILVHPKEIDEKYKKLHESIVSLIKQCPDTRIDGNSVNNAQNLLTIYHHK